MNRMHTREYCAACRSLYLCVRLRTFAGVCVCCFFFRFVKIIKKKYVKKSRIKEEENDDAQQV